MIGKGGLGDDQQRDSNTINLDSDIGFVKNRDHIEQKLYDRKLTSDSSKSSSIATGGGGAGEGVKGYSLPLMPATLPHISALTNNPYLKQIKQPTASTAPNKDSLESKEYKENKGISENKDKDAKLIPRIIWIAVKDRRDEMPIHLKKLVNISGISVLFLQVTNICTLMC